MTLSESVQTALMKKYSDFSGRAGRAEFWYFQLFVLIVVIVAGLLGQKVSLFAYLGALFLLAIIVPSVALNARRMHDIGKSGWMQLVNWIPLVGGIWFLVLCCTPGAPGPNYHGEAIGQIGSDARY